MDSTNNNSVASSYEKNGKLVFGKSPITPSPALLSSSAPARQFGTSLDNKPKFPGMGNTMIKEEDSPNEEPEEKCPGPDFTKCDNCRRYIPSARLTMHTAYCYRNTFRCEQCGRSMQKAEKEKHMEEKHTLHKCEYCSEQIQSYKLNSHMKKQCPKRPIPCPYCLISFPFSEFYDHERVCGSRTELCERCLKYIMLRDKEQHDTSNCKYSPDYGRTPPALLTRTASVFVCERCNSSLPTWDDLQVHMLTDCPYNAKDISHSAPPFLFKNIKPPTQKHELIAPESDESDEEGVDLRKKPKEDTTNVASDNNGNDDIFAMDTDTPSNSAIVNPAESAVTTTSINSIPNTLDAYFGNNTPIKKPEPRVEPTPFKDFKSAGEALQCPYCKTSVNGDFDMLQIHMLTSCKLAQEDIAKDMASLENTEKISESNNDPNNDPNESNNNKTDYDSTDVDMEL